MVRRQRQAQGRSAFLTGRGRYVDDIELPGMLHAVVLRSPHAHAGIRRHRQDARRWRCPACTRCSPMPTCRSRCSARPCRCWCRARPSSRRSCRMRSPRTRSASSASRWRSWWRTAAIIAEDAAALVEVDYEALPAVTDCRARALEPGAPLAHAGVASTIWRPFIPIKVGDTDRAFAQAAHVFREKIFQHRGGPFFMECRGMIAAPRVVTDALTIYVSSQGPHRHKRCMLDLMDWADHQVRVVTPDVGGGFGPKGSFYAEYGDARRRGAAARPAGEVDRGPPRELPRRPSRSATSTGTSRSRSIADAKILGVRGTLIHETGAYMPWGIVLPWIAATTVPGPYVIPALQARRRLRCSPTRSRPRRCAAPAGRRRSSTMERLMDRVARELKLDPRRSAAAQFHHARSRCPTRSASSSATAGRSPTTAATIRPASRRRCDAVDYEGFRARQAEARKPGPLHRHRHRQRGGGDRTRSLRERDRARLDLRQDRRLHRRHAAGPVAQDHARADRRRPIRRARPTTSPS